MLCKFVSNWSTSDLWRAPLPRGVKLQSSGTSAPVQQTCQPHTHICCNSAGPITPPIFFLFFIRSASVFHCVPRILLMGIYRINKSEKAVICTEWTEAAKWNRQNNIKDLLGKNWITFPCFIRNAFWSRFRHYILSFALSFFHLSSLPLSLFGPSRRDAAMRHIHCCQVEQITLTGSLDRGNKSVLQCGNLATVSYWGGGEWS
jgi:hypothetical protein